MNQQIRLGIRLPIYGKYDEGNPFDLIRRLSKMADSGGVDSIWVADHFYLPDDSIAAAGGEPGRNAPLEAWTTLTAVASWTKNVEIGTEVTPMTRVHPSILAKVTSTLDVLSKGRVILGAGAGWYPAEFKKFGLTWHRLEHRFEAMWESIEIVKKLWTDDEASYKGKHYHIRDARLFPKPVRKPHPPIWFGGRSERIMQSIAKYGNGWIPANNTSPEEYEAQSRRLKEILSDSERDVSEVTFGGPFLTQIDADHERVRRTIKEYSLKAAGDKVSSWNVAFGQSMLYGIWGTPNKCIELMKKYIRIGVQHFILDLIPPTTALTSLKLLCEEIIPHFKRR